MFLFMFVDKDYNIKTMIQMQMNGRPMWLIKLFNQWNNVAVFVCAGETSGHRPLLALRGLGPAPRPVRPRARHPGTTGARDLASC